MSDTKQGTIVASDSVLTLINTFTCPEVRQNELVAALEASIAEVLSTLDGFLSASVHASLDRTRVVNYVQWARVEDFDNAELHPRVREHHNKIMAVAESADPRLFHVRSVIAK